MRFRNDPRAIAEVADYCRALVAEGIGHVYLNVPVENPRGYRVHLAGRRGPLGIVACCPTSGGTTATFEPAKVLAWIESQEDSCSQ